MDCLLSPLATIPHGLWKCLLCLPRHLFPQTATLHLRLPSPILYQFLIKISTLKKKNIPAHTPTCILARHPHTRLSMGLSLRPKFFVNSSSAARRGETWDLDPDNFFLRDFFLDFFFLGIGPCRPVPPSPLEWNSILSLVTAVFITPKGAEPPGSRRIGVICALVLILPSETV